jgi:hypothetical protein
VLPGAPALKPESAATSEERYEGKDGDREQDRVDDHAAGDRDDEKNNSKD